MAIMNFEYPTFNKGGLLETFEFFHFCYAHDMRDNHPSQNNVEVCITTNPINAEIFCPFNLISFCRNLWNRIYFQLCWLLNLPIRKWFNTSLEDEMNSFIKNTISLSRKHSTRHFISNSLMKSLCSVRNKG